MSGASSSCIISVDQVRYYSHIAVTLLIVTSTLLMRARLALIVVCTVDACPSGPFQNICVPVLVLYGNRQVEKRVIESDEWGKDDDFREARDRER